jgi:hypothetical protein
VTDPTPTLVALYTWGEGSDRNRAAEFRWSPETGVTVTVFDQEWGGLAQDYYDKGVSLDRERRMVSRDEGPTFMRALLQPWNMSRYRFVDESS